VNRHLSRDIAADIATDGFRPAATASAQTLYADSILGKNDELSPNAIVPQRVQLAVASSNLSYIFRHESVTVMEFVKR
jgi:alpha-L-arabinofuranosidase